MADGLFTGTHSAFDAETKALRARVAELEGALRFYAEGHWPEDYPGGVLYAADGDEHANCLDYGDKARAALEAKP